MALARKLSVKRDALELGRVLVGRQHQRTEFRDDVELAVEQKRRDVGIVGLEPIGRRIELDADLVEPALLHADDVEGVVGVGAHAELDRGRGNLDPRLGRRGFEAVGLVGEGGAREGERRGERNRGDSRFHLGPHTHRLAPLASGERARGTPVPQRISRRESAFDAGASARRWRKSCKACARPFPPVSCCFTGNRGR